MQTVIIFSILFIIVLLVAVHLLILPRLFRHRAVSKPFPDTWEKILVERFPVYLKLPAELKKQLQQLVNVFIENKEFVGCADLEVNDEMKVLIAAQACLLLLNRPTHEYVDLRTIYLYPSTFRATREVRDELGLVSHQSHDLLGESWSNGKVILAWDDVEKGVRNFTDGFNVVLHEFAHQLDHESGVTNGAPLLYTKAAYKSWAYVLGKEFEKLQKRDSNKESIIDHYGATNPAEFFAVATETFFEEPDKLYKNHKALFEELEKYYRLDPREWL